MGRPLAEHGHDRHAGPGSGAGVTDRQPVVRAAFGERQPVDGQALHVLPELGQVLGDLRDAEELGQRSAVLGSQAEQVVRRVGVLALVHDELARAGAVMNDADPFAVLRDELVSDADPRQRGLGHDAGVTAGARHRASSCRRNSASVKRSSPPSPANIVRQPIHAIARPITTLNTPPISRTPSVITTYPATTSPKPTRSSRTLGLVRAAGRSSVSMLIASLPQAGRCTSTSSSSSIARAAPGSSEPPSSDVATC